MSSERARTIRSGASRTTSTSSGQGEWSGTSTASEKCQLIAAGAASNKTNAIPAAHTLRQFRPSHLFAFGFVESIACTGGNLLGHRRYGPHVRFPLQPT